MSLVGGLVLLAAALAIGLFAPKNWIVGWVMIGVWVLGWLVALLVQRRKGHRGRCWLARASWFTLATPGAPLRIVFNAP